MPWRNNGAVLLILMGWGLFSCARPFHTTVLYERTEGLRPGDPVIWKDQTIGTVDSLEANPQGRSLVRLGIKKEFKGLVTDQSRFLIQPEALGSGRPVVEMIHLAPGGNPLPDGAVVEGSTDFSLILERGTTGLKAWSTLFQGWLERIEQGIRLLREKDVLGEVERQIEGWARVLKRSGEETRRYFKGEVLPRLERLIRELKKISREEGREEEIRRLEERLRDLEGAT